jgi:hypothetical protein
VFIKLSILKAIYWLGYMSAQVFGIKMKADAFGMQHDFLDI